MIWLFLSGLVALVSLLLTFTSLSGLGESAGVLFGFGFVLGVCCCASVLFVLLDLRRRGFF